MSSLKNNYLKVTNGEVITYQSVIPDDNTEISNITLVGVNGDGTPGDITIEQYNGTDFTFKNAQVGSSFCVKARKIKETSTATGIYIGRVS